jgi:Domain of unknown function (DUF1833)
MAEFSRAAQAEILATAADYPLVLLQIDHSALAQPIRVVGDTQDITCNGNLYVAYPFRIDLPDDFGESLPRARLSIDNVGRELTVWLEASAGGRGATCTIRQVMRARPNTVEFAITMSLNNLIVTAQEVSGELGFEDLLNRPAVLRFYRPETAPGLFA